MLVSIITAALNDGANLQLTIDSVKSQSFKDIEHIVVDGGSTDDTIDILNRYNFDYNLKWISEKDNGISDAFNKGVRLSSGRWLLFLGAGDQLASNTTIESIVPQLMKKVEYSILWGDVDIIDLDDQILKEIRCNYSKYRLKQYMCYHHQGVFHNRKIFDHYGLFDVDVKIAMDYDLILRIYNQINKEGYLNKKISYFLDGGNSQQNYMDTIKDFYRVQKKNKINYKLLSDLFYCWSAFKYYLRKNINRL